MKTFRSKTVRLEISTGRELKAIWTENLEHENITSFRRASNNMGPVEY